MSAAIPFAKLHGAGNGYVYVDATRDPERIERLAPYAAAISDRHRGIGSDGLILIGPSDAADLRMHMWNADGSRGALCVNGLRGAARFAHDSGMVSGSSLTIESDTRTHGVELIPSSGGSIDRVRVTVPGVHVGAALEDARVTGRDWSFVRGDAGNPHAVVFLDADPESVDVPRIGAAFQQLPPFEADGVNVEFVQPRGDRVLHQRTFERGSGETLACGSGAVVAACAAIEHGRSVGPQIDVVLRGGVLTILCEENECTLTGPVAFVFEGEFETGRWD